MTELTAIDALLASSYRDSDFPVCLHQTIAWAKNRPFENLTVLDSTPIFRNTLVKHRALIAAGARLIVGRPTGIPCDSKIISFLCEAGIPVVSAEDIQTEAVDVVLDCAASFIHWTPRLGAVELTLSGVPKYTSAGKKVFVADGGRIKKIETCLGTGESYFRAMAQLGYSDWDGRRLVIFGSGKVGTGLLTYAHRMGALATVVTKPGTESDITRRLASKILDCNDIAAVVAEVANAYAAVTATGVAGALSNPRLVKALADSPALLANMGVEDEFGPAMPKERVLTEKRALNFILEEPTHLKYIDATMGLHNEGVSYLMEHPSAQGMILPSTQVEDKLLDITLRNGNIGKELTELLGR